MASGRIHILFLLVATLFATTPSSAQDHDTITQYSTLDALIAGLYDGPMTVGELAAHGELGLGTYNALDGEMIVLDGIFWRAGHDGTVEAMPSETETPFAVLTYFEVDDWFALPQGLDMAGLGAVLSERAGPSNVPIAIRLDGTFSSLTYRAPARQTKPYPPLGTALEDQTVWTAENIEATLVGFWFPDWLGHVNAPGWHLHFISADKSRAGHVLELETEMGVASLDPSPGLTILMPATPGFADLELAVP